LAKLEYPSLLANFRKCPFCSELFTVDSNTKIRQGSAILVAIVALVFTGLMYVQGMD
jgi:hypothetical protein